MGAKGFESSSRVARAKRAMVAARGSGVGLAASESGISDHPFDQDDCYSTPWMTCR